MKWHYWLRYPIWGLILLLVIRGFVGFIRPAPPPKVVMPPPPPAVQGQQAQAWASAFAREFLSWDPSNPNDREQRLRSYVASGLDMGSWSLGKAQTQTVTAAIPWKVEPLDSQRAIITVQVAATTTATDERGKPGALTRTLYLAVPVYEARGAFAVYSLPLLVPAPQAAADATPPEAAGKTFNDGDTRVKSLIEGYWRALTAGKGADVEAYMLPGSPTPRGYGGQMIYRHLADLQLVSLENGNIAARGVVILQDPVTQADLRQAFAMTLTQKDGRWYIAPDKKGA